MERLKQALSAAGIAYKENEPLSAHCTFRIGGPADVFILPENEAQLCAAIKLAKEANVKYYLLGNGSNILFEDAGYRGAVINVSAMKSAIGILENICFPGKDPSLTYDAVVVGADKMLSSLCMTALENSLTGLEFAYGIPGTVGGAVYMNAGAYGGEMKDVLVSVRYLTAEGESVEGPAEQLDLSYRHSIFEENGGCILKRQCRRHPLQDGRPDGPPQRQTASRQAQCRQHLQAAGGRICGGPYRPVRSAGLPPWRRSRQ